MFLSFVGSTFTGEPFSPNPAKLKSQRAALSVFLRSVAIEASGPQTVVLEKAYEFNCNLHNRKTRLALQANLVFLCRLKSAVPNEEFLWTSLRAADASARAKPPHTP